MQLENFGKKHIVDWIVSTNSTQLRNAEEHYPSPTNNETEQEKEKGTRI